MEDELGDVFWDFMNLLANLENENKIEIEKVFERCYKKYSQRLEGGENGISWDEVKKKQKIELKKEQEQTELRQDAPKHQYLGNRSRISIMSQFEKTFLCFYTNIC